MVWIRLCLSCAAFLSAAGGISYGLVKLSEKIWKSQNPALVLALYKLALALYWVPVSFVWICAKRISYENRVIAYKGEFVCSTVPPMTAAFRLLGILWLAGFVISIACFVVKQCRLSALRRGNVPVEQPRYLAVFEECRRQFGLGTVVLCQNDLLSSPITAGLFRQQVILPFEAYTDAELRMIYEHELTHIQNRDLLWRMFALVTSWVHWFNPVIYLQQGELDCLQEMVCDLSIAVQNEQYTKKEYAAFLLKLTEPETVSACTTALIQNKSQTLRRIQNMAKTKEVRKPKKFVVGLSCAGLAALALIPATAVSAKAAKLQEDWIRAEEVDTIEEPQDFSDPLVEEHRFDDGSVEEIDGSQEIDPYSTKVDLDKTIDANTRYIYQYRSKAAGDIIKVYAYCEDSSVTYRIGIKNKNTSNMSSISGTGMLYHEFKISENGTYTAFVENNNNFPIKVIGATMY
ncbi:MAG: M56 family metallopeptidase [Lachnospiraceae bacterium]|nr:M56 family metallopeptidase [Lachnospiraceae bacterium]